MRIALISPLYETVPPLHYGGTERVIAALANELVRRGHDVSLFAAAGSRTDARLEAMAASALRTTMSRQELEQIAPHLHLQMLTEVYHRADEFDIVHAHTDIWTLPFTTENRVPTVITMHGRLDLDVVHRVLPLYPDTPLVSISDAQRAPLDRFPMRWMGTCYNGLDLSAYLTQPRGNGEYLAFVGRMTAEKRPDWAIEIARRVGMPIRLAAKIDPLEEDYWYDVVAPLVTGGDVEFIGEIGEADKPEFFANAAATLFPIDWPEPFGLVMIESMAAGTPVIALGNGSVPEIVRHGVSGFICEDRDAMVRATANAHTLDPEDCRREASRFSPAAMVDQYLPVYEQVIALHRGRSVIELPSSGNVIELPPTRRRLSST